ncbi:Stomatin [uncultured archaeon]|nr:Stomatin [uncultured archaeon]
MCLKVINQYEKGVLFGFGNYVGERGPGLNIILPLYHDIVIVDTRVKTIEIPKQEAMTKDNVPVNINAVLLFSIVDASKAVLNVRDVIYAVSKYAQTSMRNVIGETTLDELLSERQQIADKLKEIIDKSVEKWGIDVTAIELQDIELPDSLKRTMAKQAEAERERRAVIINSEGELAAAKNIVKAANTLYNSTGALHLRTLHAINDLSSDQSKTTVYAVPIELLRVLERTVDVLEDAHGKNKKEAAETADKKEGKKQAKKPNDGGI